MTGPQQRTLFEFHPNLVNHQEIAPVCKAKQIKSEESDYKDIDGCSLFDFDCTIFSILRHNRIFCWAMSRARNKHLPWKTSCFQSAWLLPSSACRAAVAREWPCAVSLLSIKFKIYFHFETYLALGIFYCKSVTLPFPCTFDCIIFQSAKKKTITLLKNYKLQV